MSVYVDPMFPCIPTRNWRWNESCHLIADTEDELHTFAAKLGLKREWFQRDSRLPHYDLTARRRAVAVAVGAVELTRRQFVEVMRKGIESRQPSVAATARRFA